MNLFESTFEKHKKLMLDSLLTEPMTPSQMRLQRDKDNEESGNKVKLYHAELTSGDVKKVSEAIGKILGNFARKIDDIGLEITKIVSYGGGMHHAKPIAYNGADEGSTVNLINYVHGSGGDVGVMSQAVIGYLKQVLKLDDNKIKEVAYEMDVIGRHNRGMKVAGR